MKNKQMFQEYMAAMGELFDKKISEVLVSVYWKALEPYDDAEVEAAFKRLITTAKFWPKPAEIIEAIQGPQQDQAVLAWAKVDKAVRDHGPYASVEFDDPAIHGTIELMGGWVQFQNCPMDEWKWRQKEFERLYPMMVRRGNHPPALPGICEISNTGHGYTLPEPVLIGDRKQRLRLKE